MDPQRRLRMFEAAMQSSPAAIAFADLEGRITEVNDAFISLFGCDRADELVGRLNTDLDADPANVREIMLALYDRGTWVGEVSPRRRDGVILTAQATAILIRDADGAPLCTMASLFDITAQRHAQKMEAVGRLAGGIAHDFNNLLMGIVGCCRIARDNVGEGESDAALATLNQIIESAERGTKVTRKLLDFSRKSPLQRVPVVMDELLRDTCPMLRHILGEDVQLLVRLESDDATVLGDHCQIEQVIMNLAANARDAMPRGGTLEISTHRRDMPADNESHVDPGTYVVVEVQDSGVGMSQAVLDHAFEPFFTTKEEGRGTGLGLSSVFGIVTQLGGDIDVQSSPGQGACFRLLFPLNDAASPQAGGDAKGLRRGAETILVVEDELLVRLSVRHYLKSHGYEVLEAENAEDALATASAHANGIALVVTDMVLPGGMSGRELVASLRKERDELPAIYMSAYPADLLELQGRLEPGAPSLEKPFGAEDLLRLVQRVLESSGKTA